MLILSPSVAEAHFTLVQPTSWLATDNGGKGAPPCGEGTPSNVVTKVQGGHSLPIKLIETVIHPGHYRIAPRLTLGPNYRSIQTFLQTTAMIL